MRVALAAREVAKAGQLGTSAERGDVTTMSHFNHYSWPASVLAVEQQEEQFGPTRSLARLCARRHAMYTITTPTHDRKSRAIGAHWYRF